MPTDALAEELGRHPTPTEIAARLNVTVEDVLDGIEAIRPEHAVARLPRSQEEGSLTLVETLGVTGRAMTESRPRQRPPGPKLDDRSGECCACGSSTR